MLARNNKRLRNKTSTRFFSHVIKFELACSKVICLSILKHFSSSMWWLLKVFLQHHGYQNIGLHKFDKLPLATTADTPQATNLQGRLRLCANTTFWGEGGGFTVKQLFKIEANKYSPRPPNPTTVFLIKTCLTFLQEKQDSCTFNRLFLM